MNQAFEEFIDLNSCQTLFETPQKLNEITERVSVSTKTPPTAPIAMAYVSDSETSDIFEYKEKPKTYKGHSTVKSESK